VAGGEDVFHEAWEPRVFAIHCLIGSEGLGAGPGGRAVREQMDPADYLEAGYYERWLWSAEQRLLRKGTLAPGEVERMMERLAAGEPEPRGSDPAQAERILEDLRTPQSLDPVTETRFAVGDAVRVRRMRPAGHTRCPRYARGVCGVIERVQGADRLPDLATAGLEPAPEAVYSVAFASDDLWGRSGEPPWTVLLDLWESYLEAA
jgi:nitrile hydratase beta subunit